MKTPLDSDDPIGSVYKFKDGLFYKLVKNDSEEFLLKRLDTDDYIQGFKNNGAVLSEVLKDNCFTDEASK